MVKLTANVLDFSPIAGVVFTKEHEWISPGADDDHVATVGITNFAQDQIGELV